MFPADTLFTVFDVETTGLNPRGGDRIVEIAAVRIEGGSICEESAFSSLVNPECRMSWEVRSVHRLRDEDLVAAPVIADVLPKFLAFVEDSVLVAHNAEFDLGFLEVEKEMCWGYVDIPECLCTLCLSRAIQPRGYRHALEAVAERCGLPIPVALHRALPDALLTAQVLLKLIQIGGIRSLPELRAKAAPAAAPCR